MHHVVLSVPDYDYYVCLPPTSPLRTRHHVQQAMKQILDDRADSLISVTNEYRSIWKKEGEEIRPLVERRKNRQETEPVYVANGAIFICKREVLKKRKKNSGTNEFVCNET